MLAGVKTYSIFGRTGDSEDCSLLEGVVAAITARRGAPGETLILGSGGGGGGAPVSYPSWRRRLGAHGSLYVASSLRGGMFTVEVPASLVVLGMVLLRSAPMYLALGVCVCCDVRLYRFVVGHCFIYKAGRKPFSVII